MYLLLENMVLPQNGVLLVKNLGPFMSTLVKVCYFYILSKQNNTKWAVYYDIKSRELSWWNAKDILTDGYLVDLPEELKKIYYNIY